MMVEALADQAAAKGHELLYVPLSALPSFSIDDGEGAHIFLSRSLCGVQEKEALAHELGHCKTGSFYNRHAALDIRQKHENRADKWAIRQLVPEDALDQAVADGYTDLPSLAEHFCVTVPFMRKAVCWYTYGNLAADLYM